MDIYLNVVTDGRINGNLNLSRALGDLEYKKDTNLTAEKQIITAMPDITQRVSDLIRNFLNRTSLS